MHLIQRFVRLLGNMPLVFHRFGGRIIGLYLSTIPNQSSRITKLNIDLAFPELSSLERTKLARQSLFDLGDKFFRLIYTWTRPLAVNHSEVLEVEGLQNFMQESLSHPTLILLPHIGNWELFGAWLSQHRCYTAMFRPLRVPDISDLVSQARQRGGNTMVPTSTSGVKKILKNLKLRQTAIVLPDQVPKAGEGTYVHFFGHHVLTQVLPYRLAKATAARVFLGSAVRINGGFRIALTPLQVTTGCKQSDWLHQMNKAIETLVRKYPDQYQWEYGRFRNLEDGGLRYN